MNAFVKNGLMWLTGSAVLCAFHQAAAEQKASSASKRSSPVQIGALEADKKAIPGEGALSERELFGKVFGQKMAGKKVTKQKIMMPVMMDGRPLGQVPVLLASDGSEVKIDSNSLEAVLRDFILEEYLSGLKGKQDQLGYLDKNSFEGLDWKVSFDDSIISLVVEAPLGARKAQESSLRTRRPQPFGRKLEPSRVSAAFNASVAQDYLSGMDRGNGRQPTAFNVNGAMNVLSVVFEGGANYYESASPRRFVRNDLRIVKDVESKAVRLSVGDVNYGISGQQASPAMGGLSVSRNFSIRPYDIVQSSGRASFTLETESRVEFYVNGQLVATKDLPPGPHALRDFPVSSGANDIVLRIRDKFGQVKEIKIPFFYSSDLLAEGVHAFSYNAGYLSETRTGVRHYNTKVPVFSFYHRYGLTPVSTVGVNAQGSQKQTQVGAEFVLATMLGNIYASGAGSQTKDSSVQDAPRKPGHSTTLQYDVSSSQDKRARTFSAQWVFSSANFSRLGALTPSNPVSHLVSGRYSQEIYGGVYGVLSSAYGFYRQSGKRENTQTFGLSKSYNSGVMMTMDLTRLKQPFKKSDERFMVGLRWSIPGSGHSLSTDYQSHDSVRRVRWSYAKSSGVGGLSAGASAMDSSSSKGAEGNLTYTGNRFVGGVTHNVTNPRSSGSVGRTTLNLNTAVVFADGHMALSRPVSDSFVIVSPHQNLSGHTVKVNPSGDSHTARTDVLGSAVLPDISSYHVNGVSIDHGEVPVGYQIEQEDSYAELGYKQGAVLKIGTDAVVMGRGQLLDGKQQPHGLVSGEIVFLDDPNKEPILFFTNRSGRFAAEGLKPGKYKIVVYGEQISSCFVVIPEATKGVYNFNTLHTEVLQEDQNMLKEGIEE